MKYIEIPLLILIITQSTCWAKNGFNIQGSLIPESEILNGGPPRDGIPSIDHPQFMISKLALKKFTIDERAIVIKYKNETRAYPVSILNWHEIVNDNIQGKPIVISYCPLCGTGIVFESLYKKQKLSFGVSGLLYQSDMLLYDRETNSLWSQLLLKSISGKMKGTKFKIFRSELVILIDYLKKNPKTKTLSTQTGYNRNYKVSPYSDYASNKKLYFPIKFRDQKYPLKAWSLLIKSKSDQIIIIPMTKLPSKNNKVKIKLGSKNIEILYNKSQRVFRCMNKNIHCITGYFFALKTFYPKAKIYK